MLVLHIDKRLNNYFESSHHHLSTLKTSFPQGTRLANVHSVVVFNGTIYHWHSRTHYCSDHKFHNSVLHGWSCWYCRSVFYIFTYLYSFGTGWKLAGIIDWKCNFGLKVSRCCSSHYFIAIYTVFWVFQEQERHASMDRMAGVPIAHKVWVYSFYDKLSGGETIAGRGLGIWFAFVAIVICVIGFGNGVSAVVSRVFGSL